MGNLISVYKVQFLMALKQLKEYKIDFYMGLVTNIIVSLSYVLFYLVFDNLSGGILDWEYYDFILFFFMSFFTSLLLRFFWVRSMVILLNNGNLNMVLSKPVNTFFFVIIKDLRGSIIFFTFFLGLITILLSITNTSYSNYILAYSIALIGFLIQAIFLNVIFSMAFLTKGLVKYLFSIYYHNLNTAVETYTPKFFEETNLKYLAYMFPVSFIDYFFIEILKGNTTEVLLYLPYFLLFGIICLMILILQWHYGLKKYEAFG